MISRYFKVHEFVPKELYAKYGDGSWRFVDARLIATMDVIKKRFSKGTIEINNYMFGGSREWSGIRNPKSSWFSEYSMHTFGNALDFIASDYTAEEIRNDIIENPNIYPHVKGLELGKSWVHLDVRNSQTLVLFKV